jgi:RNA polymerase sigma-70 factor (ECF subfamily)
LTDPASQPNTQGEGHALSPEAIYRAELPYVWHSLRRLGVHDRDVDDLAQELFLRAFRALDQYDRARPLRPWLFGFALRLASDYRQLHRHTREVDDPPDMADPAPGPEENLEKRRAEALVQRALAALPLERRAVFVLHELNGHSIPEVAEAVGVPLNTAYSRLRIARAEFTKEAQRLMQGGQP